MTPAPLPEPSDQTLIAAYRQGDQRAASELVRRHGPAVARFLYSSGSPAADIEDLVQETFFRAFRGLERWRGEASFRSWLFTIAGNLTRDAFRRRKGHEVITLEDRDLADGTDPDAELAAGELEARLRAELGRLPRLQREVFLLRAQDGASYEEIARSLGTTPGAARVHYHHAVKRLKEQVG